MGKYLIFGSTGGIGSAIAQELHDGQHDLHLAGRNETRLREMASMFSATWSKCDVLQAGQVEAAVKAAGDDIDGLVFAVGSINLKPVGKLTETDFLRDFELNALAAAKAVQAALLALKAGQGGSVLLFSTVAVQQGFSTHASVSMAKGAVEGLTRALAAELAPKVRVNAIAPSLTDTEIAKPITASDQMAKAIASMHAIPRLGLASDMAALAGLLLTSQGSWITGQIIGVDGGRSTLRTKG
ncbi:MAG: SDR family oxidoreductase [Pseudomonadota bacterium]